MANFSKFDYRMFDLARKVAETSDFKNFHMGCVLTYQKKIIATSSNSNKTHPVQRKYNKKYRKFKKGPKPIKDSLHAEIGALVSVPYPIEQNIDWRQVKVYIYRICKGKTYGFGLARPCEACMNALRDKGIHKIYYTTDVGFAMEEIY